MGLRKRSADGRARELIEPATVSSGSEAQRCAPSLTPVPRWGLPATDARSQGSTGTMWGRTSACPSRQTSAPPRRTPARRARRCARARCHPAPFEPVDDGRWLGLARAGDLRQRQRALGRAPITTTMRPPARSGGKQRRRAWRPSRPIGMDDGEVVGRRPRAARGPRRQEALALGACLQVRGVGARWPAPGRTAPCARRGASAAQAGARRRSPDRPGGTPVIDDDQGRLLHGPACAGIQASWP